MDIFKYYLAMLTCRKCNNTFPVKILIDGKTHSLSKRKFCLTCSPFGKHNTRSLDKGDLTEHWCPRCEKILPIKDFYMRRNGLQPSPYCKKHTHLESMLRQRRFKQKCVDYKGGECQKCGYSKCLGALHFHHRDPNTKITEISFLKSRKFESAKDELDKCDLLCAICHAEAHELVTLEGVEPT